MTERLLNDFRRCCVATPTVLADAMVRVLGDEEQLRWLEPCVGEGAIVRALARLGVEAVRIRGLDIDQRAGSADGLAKVLRCTEYLTWALATSERFDRIVANPPYIPLAHASEVARTAARTLSFKRVRLSGRANCWSAFLLASVRLLREGGSLAFLLPAAWEYADYASALRRNIPRWFSSVLIIRSLEPMCENVSDANVVLVASGFGGRTADVRRAEVNGAIDAAVLLKQGVAATTRSVTRRAGRAKRLVSVSDILSVRIGAVTGDSKVFLLNESDRLSHQLPEAALRPVITRARHAFHATLTRRKWEILRDANERVWLFEPSQDCMDNPAVADYIERGSKLVNKNAYKIAQRQDWFRVPTPPKAQAFLSGMSKTGPQLCLNRMQGLSATNTLYVATFLDALRLDTRAAWSLSFLSSAALRGFARVARRYPDGLRKIEPGDLMSVEVPEPRSDTGALQRYEHAMSVFLTEGAEAAACIADAWLSND
jgi:adenine-specific DNA-methyltransferase